MVPLLQRLLSTSRRLPLTIKANDVEVNLDGDLPETYELVYEGFVNKDKAETVFTDMPVATVNLPEPLTAGTYPIKVSVSEEPENYVVTTVDGTLTVKDGSSVAGVSSKNDKVAYANGNLYVPLRRTRGNIRPDRSFGRSV